jgi:hypothetical protein
MHIPKKLLEIVAFPARTGAEMISSVRAVMFYLGDELCGEEGEKIIPFQSIDSQTDHIELSEDSFFPEPTSRASISQGNVERLSTSSVRSVFRPDTMGYDAELKDIFITFAGTYHAALSDLLESDTM